jgi:DNA-binding NarL/FixJ family response regulator
MGAKRIMIYCDQELTMYFLSHFLKEHNFNIVISSNDVWDIVEQAPRHDLDCILIEARRMSLNGMKELSIIKGEFPELRAAILSASTKPRDIINALNMGADGYLLKNTMPDDFIKDFESVCCGNICISRALIGTVLHSMRDRSQWKDNSPAFQLTNREHEIMALMANGESNREIADHTSLSVNTINNHVANIYNKIGTHNRISTVSLWESTFHNGDK